MNCPATPHFSGAWERELKLVTVTLWVVVGSQIIPEEVLHKLLVEVEGILNSKPLGYVSSDVADSDPVTPNILLMGRWDASLPQVIYTPESLTKKWWHYTQTIVHQFWSYYTWHYLPDLQPHQRWQWETKDLSKNSVVMIVDSQFTWALWPVGRVMELIPSDNGHIQSAKVKVNDCLYLWPVAKLIQLPALPDIDLKDSKD